MIAPLLLFMAIAMGYELSDGLRRAARAAREVRSMDASLKRLALRLSLAAEAADVGFWSVDTDSGAVWATAKNRELLGLAPLGTCVCRISLNGCIGATGMS
ncbi:MAG: hypothetical protein MZV49_06610 [Rhodopseudomonas palustris]|nr:hypothetical protein [Rhodopseudomonas palustris]